MGKRIILIINICGLVGLSALVGWKVLQRQNHKIEVTDYQKAKQLLSANDPTTALPLILKYQDQLYSRTPRGMDWLPLLSDALMQMHDEKRVAELYLNYPRLIDQDERKAFAVAEGLIASRQVDAYKALRKEWKSKPHHEAAWFPLDADALIVQGKKAEAIALLETQRFDSPDDSLRLIRLAVYKAGDNLPLAWNLLTQALVVDPKNSHIYSYRGHILEKWQQPALARREYQLAIEKNPDEAFLYDQLAEFYRRQSLMKKALETWSQTFSLPHSDPYRIKYIFWNLVTIPLPIDWNKQPIPKSELKPFIDFLASLPPQKLWNEQAFETLPNDRNLLITYQETFWLRLVDALLKKREEQALELLTHNIFANNLWSPELANGLVRILNYRLHKDRAMKTSDNYHHPFFQQLENLTASKELESILRSPYAFAVAFLAAGWFRATLDFEIPSHFPESTPPWVPYAYTQAIRYVQSPVAALEFANKQKSTKSMELLIGQLLIETSNIQEALIHLKPLVDDDSAIGQQAAIETAQLALQRQDYRSVKAIIAANPRLRTSSQGKEFLAKVALAQGDRALADQLYGEIETQSAEAKFYLAEKARHQRDFTRAHELIDELLIQSPGNLQLINELEKIKKGSYE